MSRTRWIWSACAVFATALATAQPAQAALVTYGTSGTFGCGTIAPCVVVNGGATLVVDGDLNGTATALHYTPIVIATREVPPTTNISLGSFFTVTGDASLLDGATFSLTVNQAVPADSGNFDASLTGRVTATSSSVFVTFDTLSVHLAPYLYSLISADTLNPGRIAINPTGELTAINAQLSYVPEPGSMMLFGTALFGLVGMRRRFTTV